MKVEVKFHNLPGTEAAVGWTGSHTIIADRPEGKAGGRGLGFNGAQLLALALGGCFCNDLRYAAEKLGVEIGEIAVDVMLELAGEPLVATRATMSVLCKSKDGSDALDVVNSARSSCMVGNSLAAGFPVEISMST
ncbi:OsmC family protein [Thalassococcus sp. CAU 1522]|uniref:OsmC family protein n=1 Tax=Thalassococcus arenae TaxID=2851652 RepID=A0ABS6N525_9RHOB|nr:OsmC family protein [Thalassococcus arenae]MBV2359118.1 OsmC family protein [Thalassococcus arenae]